MIPIVKKIKGRLKRIEITIYQFIKIFSIVSFWFIWKYCRVNGLIYTTKTFDINYRKRDIFIRFILLFWKFLTKFPFIYSARVLGCIWMKNVEYFCQRWYALDSMGNAFRFYNWDWQPFSLLTRFQIAWISTIWSDGKTMIDGVEKICPYQFGILKLFSF